MTFKDVALKNFIHHIKKYFMCFLCSSFSIMILFMYSTLLFNNSILESDAKRDGIDILLYISLGAVIVFSIFFVNYSTNAFLKSRYKEFGVMMTMGLNKNDILKIIVVENLVIFISSLCTGITAGSVFSRLFQMKISDILSLSDVSYSISIKSFIFTICIFAIIFVSEIIMFLLFTRKLTIEELLKKEKQNQGKPQKKLITGIFGTIIFIAGVISLFIVGNNEDLRSNVILDVLIIAVIFVSVYIVISSLGITFISLLKSMPSFYNKNIIPITSINKKFNDKKLVIFVLTLLSTLVLFAIAPPAALMKECASVVDLNKHELEITSLYGINNITDDKVREIADKYDIDVQNIDSFEFIPVNFKSSNGGFDMTSKKIVMSESDYNKNSEYNVNVNAGSAVKFTTSWTPDSDKMIKGDNVELESGDSSFEVTVIDVVSSKWICNEVAIPAKSVLVLNDNDYNNIKAWFDDSSVGHTYMYNLSKWIGEDDFAKEIRENILQSPTSEAYEYLPFVDNYMFMAKPFLLDHMRQGYKFFLFMTSMVGILFFIASAAVLFFNQYIEISESREKFKKLYKIGIRKKEIKSIISKELLVTFFTPVIFASILGAILINFTAKLMGGSDMMDEFMRSTYKVIIIYFVLQIIFYIFTRISYIRKCLNVENN